MGEVTLDPAGVEIRGIEHRVGGQGLAGEPGRTPKGRAEQQARVLDLDAEVRQVEHGDVLAGKGLHGRLFHQPIQYHLKV